MSKYVLLNAAEMNRKHPLTFEIPSPDEISELKPGNAVKLCFEEPGLPGERMWVRITRIEGDFFTGVLDNDPFKLQTIKYNDEVNFNSCHIYNLSPPDPTRHAGINLNNRPH